MPKIPSLILRSTFNLYASSGDAERGANVGGAGFFVGWEIGPRVQAIFAVSNWHVAVRGGFSVIRVNRMSGGHRIMEYGPEDWVFEPKSHDIAVVPAPFDEGDDIVYIGADVLLTEEIIKKKEIGPGEDVFMLGRFIDDDSAEFDRPAARFGNISMMPVPISQANGAKELSYVIDMHSRSGFSGSPVFVYRTSGADLSHGTISLSDRFTYLLGVHWGQFPEHWPIVSAPHQDDSAPSEARVIADEKFVKGLSGMTCVAPASAITRLLQHAKLRPYIKEREDLFARLVALSDE